MQMNAQFADQRLLHQRQADLQPLRRMRPIADRMSSASDLGLADTKFSRQVGHRFLAALNVSADFRSSCRVGVKVQFQDKKRSLTKQTPLSKPIPFNQSSDTKHAPGGILHKRGSDVAAFDPKDAATEPYRRITRTGRIRKDAASTVRCYFSPTLKGASLPGGVLSSAIASSIATAM